MSVTLCAGKTKRAEPSGLSPFFAPLFASRQKVEKELLSIRMKRNTSVKPSDLVRVMEYNEAGGRTRRSRVKPGMTGQEAL